MKVIICGAGRIADELLKRVGAHWEVTVIDKDEAKLAPFARRFPNVSRLMAEDASSPVILERAGLPEKDALLAMTNDDAVNLAIVRFAREAGVKTVMAAVRDPERLPEFQQLDVRSISVSTDAARKVYQFLKDPRMRVIDLGDGEGELLELAVQEQDIARIDNLLSQTQTAWRLVGILRRNELLFTEGKPTIEAGDRLLFIGKAELYNTLSNRLAEERLHFPRTYGQQMILGVRDDEPAKVTELLNEALYLAQGTHIDQIKTICEKAATDMENLLSRWSESLEIEMVQGEGDLEERVVDAARQTRTGIVVLPYTKRSMLRSLLSGDSAQTARRLPCPLLLAKLSEPYESILVPFAGALSDQRALEIAMDLSCQLDAAVSVIVVVEPSYLRGESAASGQWENGILKQVRELSLVHKIKVNEMVRRGNPVKEIAAAARDHQLLVMAGNEGSSGLFSIDVAGMIVDKAPCSVLVVSPSHD